MHVLGGGSGARTGTVVSSVPTDSSLRSALYSPASRSSDVPVGGCVPLATPALSAYGRPSPVHTASVGATSDPPSSTQIVYGAHPTANHSVPPVATYGGTATAASFPLHAACKHAFDSYAAVARRPTHTAASCVAQVNAGPALAPSACPGSCGPSSVSCGPAEAPTASASRKLQAPGSPLRGCQATPAHGAHSLQQRSSGGAVGVPGCGYSHIVVSLSITVVNHTLETPLPGLDPLCAPFSSKRITRLPVIRVYGIINEAYSQCVPASSQGRGRKRCDSRRASVSSSSNAVSLGNKRNANKSPVFTAGSRGLTRRRTAQRRNSESGCSHAQSAGLISADYSDASRKRAADHGTSSVRPDPNMETTSINNLTESFTQESDTRHVLPTGSVSARTARGASDGIPSEVCSGVASASRTTKISFPKCHLRSLLGPPAAYSAVARKLNSQGSSVEPLDVLKGRSCCAAIHGVLPYFYVPLPLEAHAHPRTWLRWFCSRLEEAEQQWGKQHGLAGNSMTQASSSDSRLPDLLVHPDAAAGVSSKEENSCRLRQQPQQIRTSTDYSNRTKGRDTHLSRPNDSHVLIYDAQLVWRRSLYGYDHASRLFVQVFTLLPGFETRRLAGLLLQGTVTGQRLQPFEAHIPFTLHFLADFKLRGMDTLIVCDPLFVAPFVLSPKQLCNDDDLLLSEPCGPRYEGTSSASAAEMQRRLSPRTSCTEGRTVTTSEGSCGCVTCTGAEGPAADLATDASMQPPAGVLLFTSWRKLWDGLSGAAAETAARDFATRPKKSHKRSDSTVLARAAVVDRRRLPGALRAAPACDCTSTSSCPCPCSLCWCHRSSFPKCSPGVPGGGGQDVELRPMTAEGPAAGAYVDPALLSSPSKARNADNFPRSSSSKLRCAPAANRGGDATSFAISSVSCSRGAPGEPGLAAGVISSKSGNTQDSKTSCSYTCSCGGNPSWVADINWPGGEGRRKNPLLPLSKRTTSCEVEFHAIASQIMNPLFEAHGALDSHSPGLVRTHNDGGALTLSQQPLLSAVRDYWHEEAVRAAALGMQFTHLEYPVKLTPPPTLPPAAVSALRQRQCGRAEQAVPQAYRERLRHLLTRVGVVPSAPRLQHPRHELQLSRSHHLHEQHLHLQEERSRARTRGYDVATEGPQPDDGGWLEGGGTLTKKQNGFSVVAAHDVSLCQTTQQSLTPSLPINNRIRSSEDADAAATKLFEIAKDQEEKHFDAARVYPRSTPAARESVKHEQSFLFSISQQPPSPSGIWPARHQDTLASSRHWENGLRWLLRERTISPPCTLARSTRNAAGSHLSSVADVSGTFRRDFADAAHDAVVSVDNLNAAAECFCDGTTLAVDTPTGIAGAASSCAFIPESGCPSRLSAVCTEQTTLYAKEGTEGSVCRGGVAALSGGATYVVDACRTTSPTKTHPLRHGSNLLSEKEVCIHTGSADCRIAVTQEQELPAGGSKTCSQSGTDKMSSLSPQNYGRNAGIFFVSGDPAAAAEQSKEHSLPDAFVFSDNSPEQQAHDAKAEYTQSAGRATWHRGGGCGDAKRSTEQAGSGGTLPAIGWQRVNLAWSSSEYSGEAEESQNGHQERLHRGMKTVNRRRIRRGLRGTQSTHALEQGVQLQNENHQFPSARRRTAYSAQQSTSVAICTQQQSEARGTGERHDTKPLETEIRDEAGRRRSDQDDTVAMELAAVKIAPAGRRSACAAAAGVASAATSNVASPLKAGPVVLTAVPELFPGVEPRSVLVRNVPEREVTEMFQAETRRSLAAACILRAVKQRGRESEDYLKSESSFSSRASTVVLLSADNSDGETAQARSKKGALRADQREKDFNGSGPVLFQEGEEESRRSPPQAVEVSSRVEDLLGLFSNTPEIEVQSEKPALPPDDILPQVGGLSTTFPGLHTVKRPPQMSTTGSDLQRAPSERPFWENPRIAALSGLSRERRQQQRQERIIVRSEVGAAVIADKWPDVPVLLPFYGDPLDSPLHSQRSTLIAAKVCSHSLRLSPVQRGRGKLQREGHGASTQHIDLSLATASRGQRSPKACKESVLEKAGGPGTEKAQGVSQGQHLSQATSVAAVDADDDVHITLDASSPPVLVEVIRSFSESERQQQPQLQEVKNCWITGFLQEVPAGVPKEECCYQADNNLASMLAGTGVKGFGGRDLPVQGEFCQTLSSGEERASKSLATHSSALKTCSGCSGDAPSCREETPSARLVTWHFCQPPPLANVIIATCPLVSKQWGKRRARPPQRRPCRVGQRLGLMAYRKRAKSTRYPHAVLSGPYPAKGGVYPGSAFASARRRYHVKHNPTHDKRTRRKMLLGQTTLVTSSESIVPSSLHCAQACNAVIQNETIPLACPAAKAARLQERSFQALTADPVLQDTKGFTASQREDCAPTLPAESLKGPDLHAAASDAEGDDDPTGGSPSSGNEKGFRGGSSISCETVSPSAPSDNRGPTAKQSPTQRIAQLSHECSAEATPAHSTGMQGHCGARSARWRTSDYTSSLFKGCVPGGLSESERGALSQHAAVGVGGCDAAGRVLLHAAAPVGAFVPRKCAPDGFANSGACGAGKPRDFEGTCGHNGMEHSQIRPNRTSDAPLSEERTDTTGSGCMLSSARSGHRPTQSCRSTSLVSVEIPTSTSGRHDRVIGCTTTENAHANEDDTGYVGGSSQLSAGFESTWALQAASRRIAASAEAEADAAAAATAIMNYQGHRLSYGSLMVVEVLAERMGCSEDEPEGLGGPTWKDAALAVAFAVRDERLRAACEQLRNQITATQKAPLLWKQGQKDGSDAGLRQSIGRSKVSYGASFRCPHDSHVPAAAGAVARKRAFSRERREANKVCHSGEKVSCTTNMLVRGVASGFTKEPQIKHFSQAASPPRRITTAEVEGEKHCHQGQSNEGSIFSLSQTGRVLARSRSHGELNACDCNTQATVTAGSGTENETCMLREKKKQDNPARVGTQGSLTYHDALAVIYIDRPYVANTISQISATPSAAKATCENRCGRPRRRKDEKHFLTAKEGVWAARPAANCNGTDDMWETPFAFSFADFMVLWQEKHPSLDARAQLKNYIPANTQLFAVKNEHELLRKTALLLTLIDPSIVLQWDGNVAGLGYLLRRAAVLGCDSELSRALSRRIDTALLWQLSPIFTPSRGGTGETPLGKGHTNRAEADARAAGPTVRVSRGNVGENRHERHYRLPQDEQTVSARLVLDCERVLQQEVKLHLSTLEGVVQEVLGVTLPTIPTAILLNLWKQGQLAQRRAERQGERAMMAAWKLWERRRIRSRWPVARWPVFRRPVSGQPHATVEGSEQQQQQSGYYEEKGLRREEHAQQREFHRVHQLMNENLKHSTSPCAYNSWPRPEKDSEDLTWGVSTMGAVLKHLLRRLQAILAVVDQVDVLPRTAELARLYGCDFHSALTRGSQFKVESVMLRATKRLGYVFASPSQKQVTEQVAPLCVPLVLEPHSGFYWSPVLVLDFQSLYPSVMIANNICFSTSLGSVNVDPTVWPVKAFGVVNLHVPPRVFQQINLLCRRFTEQRGRCTVHHGDVADVHTKEVAGHCQHLSSSFPQRVDGGPDRELAVLEGGGELQQVNGMPDSGIILLPNGSMFVSPTVRQGVFPRILWDLLRTRVMIKKMMNQYRDCGNERLVQLLNYRQHGLKMIANVSYGYTAASFTGHMPCAEVADAIVQAARTTLVRAIQLVENTPRWGGRVLYGDTDSLFVLVERKSLEAAFEIGREIAYAVTQQNPPPVELQLEKVFLPCCLVSKKRYVGNAYTSPQAKPYFDAKAKVAYERLCAVAKVLDQHSADTGPAASIPGHFPTLVHLQVGVLPRSERVPFVYAERETGNVEVYSRRRRGCRLLDFAVSPDKVEGGGRSGAWMQLFCREAPQFILRNILPRRIERLTDGLGGTHLRKAYRCCSDFEVGEKVSLPHDMEETLLIRDWAERCLGRNEQRRILTVCARGSHLKMASGGQHISGASNVYTVCRQRLQLPAKGSTQALLPLYVKYYIVKQIIPALSRLLSLLPSPISADLSQWYACMPKVRRTGPRLLRSFQRGFPRWKGAQRARRLQVVHGTRVTRLSKGELGRPPRCARLLGANYRRHSGRITRVPHLMHEKYDGGGGSVLLDAVPPSCRTSGWRGYGMRQHVVSVHDSNGLQCRRADEQGCHQRISRVSVDVCVRKSVQPTTRKTVLDVAFDEGNIKARADLGLTNKLKKANKHHLEMEALCEACAGSKIGGAACSHAWHCEIYFRKLRTEGRIREALSRMH